MMSRAAWRPTYLNLEISESAVCCLLLSDVRQAAVLHKQIIAMIMMEGNIMWAGMGNSI